MKNVFLTLLLLAMVGCSKFESNSTPEPSPQDIKPIIYTPSVGGTGIGNGVYQALLISDSKTYSIDSDGKLKTMASLGPLSLALPIRSGTLVKETDPTAPYKIILRDGEEINTGILTYSPPIGETPQGLVIFRDLTTFSIPDRKVGALSVNVEQPFIQSMSRAFVAVGSYKTLFYQILDTASGRRTNVEHQEFLAYNDRSCFVRDSRGTVLDSLTGLFTSIPTFVTVSLGARAAFTETSDGTIYVGGWEDPGRVKGGSYLMHLDLAGKLVPAVTTAEFRPLPQPEIPSNSYIANIFVRGEYVLVREIDAISLVELGVDEKISILKGMNVMSMSVSEDAAYFLAEDLKGRRVIGRYEFRTGVTSQLDGTPADSKRIVPLGL